MMILFSVLFFTFVVALLLMSVGLMLKKKGLSDQEFQSPFECGFGEFNKKRSSFSNHFFLVALIFLIFDMELAVMFPFFLSMNSWGSTTELLGFTTFIFILVLALFNEWNQLSLEWSK